MDISLIKRALAEAARAISGLTCTGYVPDSVSEPAFVAGPVVIDWDETMRRGSDEVIVTCWLLVSRTDDEAGQLLLDAYLGHGPQSIKAALEADDTLGGLCDWLMVARASGYQMYEVALHQYFGAQLAVRVGGSGEE